jgi:carboxyl-terminal processing protease
MPTMEPEPIQAAPTTESEPPDVTSLTTGTSQASVSPAAGRGRGRTLRRAVIGLALAVAFCVGIGVGSVAVPALGNTTATTPTPTSSGADFGLIREAWDTLHKEYVGAKDMNDQTLIYGAINGMTEAVGDTGHTSFLTPAQRAATASGLSGSYVGIGVRIDVAKDGLPLVIGVFKGSPAEKAGVNEGDEIVSVDGNSTAGRTLDEVSGWVRGEAGSKVNVTLRPGADGKTRDLSITRADVAVVPVTWAMVPGTHTAMIRLEQFSHGATDAVKSAVTAARAAGADRLVLDLRGNPGGYVNEAEGIASQFLTSGLIYVERDAAGHETKHQVSPNGVATDLPMVVLVDGGTASASEIVSGALQDAGRAEIIGTKTFGTGTVLGEFPLSDGSALRVGTVEWLTPSGREIWHHGITPDDVVERASTVDAVVPDDLRSMTPAKVGAIKDPQVAEAIKVATTAAAPAPGPATSPAVSPAVSPSPSAAAAASSSGR